MEKLVLMRSIYRSSSTYIRSARINQICSNPFQSLQSQRSIFSLSSSINRISFDCRPSIAIGGIGSTRTFSEGLSHMPTITDPDIKNAFKDLMAMSWDDLSNKVVNDAKQALSKTTEDKSGQESLTNLLRAAEACEEFGGILTSLKMEIDDSVGMSGENVSGLSEEVANALRVVFQRYTTYLGSFSPDEVYLQKKVETELGAKMIYLKMRVSGIGSEWGKVSVLGTSGLSGSYIEQRGP